MNLQIEKIRKEKPLKALLNFAIINIDKPAGPTSFAISQYVRRALNLAKTSHFGTLDPMVTGVLPVGLGRACRLSDYFMHRDKTYVGIMRLHEDVSEDKLKSVISDFIGKITQLPPVRSRVKRELREREVKSFDIIEIEGKDVLFKSTVQAGTYIRKLIFDMGEQLGGAHMLELRRTQAGIFDESRLYTLYDFDKAVEALKKGDEKPLRNMLIPGEIIATLYPVFEVNKRSLKQLLTGKPLFNTDIIGNIDAEEDVLIGVCNNKFVGIYRIVNEGDIIARPEFVYN